MSSIRSARRTLAVSTAMYRCGLANAADVVDAATDLLAAGEGNMLLAQLAGIPTRQAEDEVWRALPGVMESVGIPLFDVESDECRLLAADGLAQRYRKGSIDSRELTRRMHAAFSHHGPDLVEALAVLDDAYDSLPYAHDSEDEIEFRVRSAATALAEAVNQILQRSAR